MSTRRYTSKPRPAANPPAKIDPVGEVPAEVAELPVVEVPAPVERAADGRPVCDAAGCDRPEFLDDMGLCGGHYALRADMRKGRRNV